MTFLAAGVACRVGAVSKRRHVPVSVVGGGGLPRRRRDEVRLASSEVRVGDRLSVGISRGLRGRRRVQHRGRSAGGQRPIRALPAGVLEVVAIHRGIAVRICDLSLVAVGVVEVFSRYHRPDRWCWSSFQHHRRYSPSIRGPTEWPAAMGWADSTMTGSRRGR